MKKIMHLVVALSLGVGSGLWFGRERVLPAPFSHREEQPTLPLPPASPVQETTKKIFDGNAAAFLLHLTNLPGRQETFRFLYREIAQMPAAQLASYAEDLATMPSTNGWHSEVFDEVLLCWGKTAPDQALAWGGKLPPDQQAEVMPKLLTSLAEHDSKEAVRLSKQLGTPAARCAAVQGIATVLAIRHPQEAFALLQETPGALTSAAARSVLVAWGQTDPQAALGTLLGLPAGKLRNELYDPFFSAWALADPVNAMAGTHKIEPAETRWNTMRLVLNAWAESDSASAMTWLMSLPAGDRARLNLRSFVGLLATKDPAQARALLPELTADQRDVAMQGIAMSWMKKDRAAALRWLATLPSGPGKDHALAELAPTTRGQPASQAIELSQQITSASQRQQFLTNCFYQNVGYGETWFHELLQNLGPDDSSQLLQGHVLSELAKTDAGAAARLLTTHGAGDKTLGWSEVAQRYSEQDPSAAMSWAQHLPVDVQEMAMGGIFSNLAKSDPAGSLEMALQIGDRPSRDRIVSMVCNAWASQDSATLEAASGAMEGDMRLQCRRSIIDAKMRRDPADAARFLLQLQQSVQPQDVIAGNSAYNALGQAWGREDPTAAAVWVTQVPEGKLRDAFIENLAIGWTQKEPMKASIWIKDMPPGGARDRATGWLLANITSSDPLSAVEWARQIQDVELRTTSLQSALGALIRKDATAGKQAAEAAPLSEGEKRRLLQGP